MPGAGGPRGGGVAAGPAGVRVRLCAVHGRGRGVLLCAPGRARPQAARPGAAALPVAPSTWPHPCRKVSRSSDLHRHAHALQYKAFTTHTMHVLIIFMSCSFINSTQRHAHACAHAAVTHRACCRCADAKPSNILLETLIHPRRVLSFSMRRQALLALHSLLLISSGPRAAAEQCSPGSESRLTAPVP